MDKPLVTIITPSYKSKRFISSTIQSVLNQSLVDFEMLIVDDSSPDGSADFIESLLPDNRFKLIRLNDNVGAAEARNVALNIAKGRFIAFLDSDDLWVENKLELQIDFMMNNNIAFSYSSYQPISENGELAGNIISVPAVITRSDYLKNTIIGCLTVMIDKDKVSTFKMPNLRSSHDMALWLDIMRVNSINAYGINDVLGYYRIVSSSNTAQKSKAAKDVWSVYRDYLKLNIISSTYYFIWYAFNAIKKRL
ncbi:glycosyltransferase family 2 protein [Colwellia hornerae]|uniref:Glycosyltransferase family 2 protein n=1 Tax=Colwellia hornerae TaxID=89402 RepID=A0A5C6QJZ4_9GAMM|nr:glycosyltransferase family 2 protein [Colwellia hornerae]TWX54046.1 glycosyltransferase family 2 protein [Colwellia hornerae]TWX60821.1 glycosyltransferase family 2 protein [Colwellia hornerae]TWX69151.1 glycosyltransferase family 2 protein [Colwellia hornerae]